MRTRKGPRGSAWRTPDSIEKPQHRALADGWSADLLQRSALEAALRHALDFGTWMSLTRQGRQECLSPLELRRADRPPSACRRRARDLHRAADAGSGFWTLGPSWAL
jgi:hypothetical protein